MVLDGDSWAVAQRMLRAPVTAFQGEQWPRKRAQALRRFTWQALERHLERRLRTVDAAVGGVMPDEVQTGKMGNPADKLLFTNPDKRVFSMTAATASNAKHALTFQEVLFRLQSFWAERGCILQQPFDVEVGAGTMAPETFLRVLGPRPYKVGYAQPSRRPADGRYGENPNRLFRHTQFQLILKPPPVNVQELYLQSLEAIGIDLSKHDLKFEEDNWEGPTVGAWGVGWQVMMDGMEITQFTYFQQCGGLDLDPMCAELTYGLERLTAFLQDVDSVYDVVWARDPQTGEEVTYGDVRLEEELQYSVYNFETADVAELWEHFNRYEREATKLIQDANAVLKSESSTLKEKKRFPLMSTYELALKCSNLFNLLDARGAISVTERVGMIARIRNLAVGVAKAYQLQQTAA